MRRSGVDFYTGHGRVDIRGVAYTSAGTSPMNAPSVPAGTCLPLSVKEFGQLTS
jgi:hypothetical protein